MLEFADALRAAGHKVAVPDLFSGRIFTTVEDGVAHAESLGFDEITSAGVALADELPNNLVYAGMSLGLMPAQKLAQTRPGAQGAILLYDAIAHDYFADSWPADVPVQIHLNTGDEWSDKGAAQSLTVAANGELFVYPGSTHLFMDSSSADHEVNSARLAMERILEFLSRLA